MYNDLYGVINAALLAVGVIGEPWAWTADPDLALAAVIAVDVWKTTPFMTLLILAALQMLPRAARGGLRLVVAADARGGSPGSKVTLGLRSEHLRESVGGNALRVIVVAVERLGGESLVHAKLSSGELITWRVVGSSDAKPGDTVSLDLDIARCHLFDEAGNAFSRLG